MCAGALKAPATGFPGFASAVRASRGGAPPRHHRALITALEKTADGCVDRLMVLMPPGAAKSTYGPILFPASWFIRHPTSEVAMACRPASLAEHLGRRLQEPIAEHGAAFDLALGKAGRLVLSTGGKFFGAGCGDRSPGGRRIRS